MKYMHIHLFIFTSRRVTIFRRTPRFVGFACITTPKPLRLLLSMVLFYVFHIAFDRWLKVRLFSFSTREPFAWSCVSVEGAVPSRKRDGIRPAITAAVRVVHHFFYKQRYKCHETRSRLEERHAVRHHVHRLIHRHVHGPHGSSRTSTVQTTFVHALAPDVDQRRLPTAVGTNATLVSIPSPSVPRPRGGVVEAPTTRMNRT